jgi:hypothetical protein
MKSERVTFMKVTYNGEKHYLERFPDSFQQLTLLVMKKCRMASIQDLCFYLVDTDGEQVVVNCDSDIEHIRRSLQLANESTAKIFIERRASKPTADAPNTEDSTNSPPKESFESKYYDYLKHNLGNKINKQFETHLMFDKLPCKLCFGSGQRGTYGRCSYCNDTGSRPLTKKWKLILALIEFKIKEYVMNPLSQYLGKPKEECVDNVLSCLDDGTSDSEIDDLDGSYEEEAFPLDESFIEKAVEEEYSRRKKSSQGSHKQAKEAVEEPLKDPQKRPEEKEQGKKPEPMPPLRKTSVQLTAGNSQTSEYRQPETQRPASISIPTPTLTQSGLVQMNRQTNDWGNKNLMNLNANSVNQSSVNQNSLSNMGSFMNSTDGRRSSTFQITTRNPGDMFSSGFQNESGNNTFQSYQVKTYKSKPLDFEWLDAKEEVLVHQSNDYLLSFKVKNKSTTVWKKGLTWNLSLDGKTEAFVQEGEVNPEEVVRIRFNLGKHSVSVLDVENMFFNIKWTDEEENCKYFSEKKYIRIIFVK